VLNATLSPVQGAIVVFLSLFVLMLIAMAVGALLRMRFGDGLEDLDVEGKDPLLTTYLAHRDRGAPCVCLDCRAWRAQQRQRMQGSKPAIGGGR
jgi:hypothetical protein